MDLIARLISPGKMDAGKPALMPDASKEDENDSNLKANKAEKEVLEDEDIYHQVVDKMKVLYDTLGYDKTPEGFIPEETFRERFASIYAPEFQQVMVEPANETADAEKKHGPPSNYETVLEEHIKFLCQRSDVEFKIFRYRHCAVGTLEAYIRFSTADEDFEVAGLWNYSNNNNSRKDPQMMSSTLTRFALTPKVPGQVSARARTNITKSTSERAFGRQVIELPSAVQGRILGSAVGMRPVLHSYEFLRITMRYTTTTLASAQPQNVIELWENTTAAHNPPSTNGSSSMSFATTTEKKEQPVSRPYAHGATFVHTKGSVFAMGKKKWPTFTLYGRNNNNPLNQPPDQPVARMEQHSNTGFTIYGTKPLVSHPSSTDEDESDHLRDCRLTPTSPGNIVGFHPWLKLDTRGTQTSTGYLIIVHILTDYAVSALENKSTKSLQTMEGDSAVYEPLYKVHVLNNKNQNKKQPTKSDATTRIEDYYHGTRVAIVQGDVTKFKRAKGKPDPQLRVDIAPGVDPAMILCIVACLEELKQKGMK